MSSACSPDERSDIRGDGAACGGAQARGGAEARGERLTHPAKSSRSYKHSRCEDQRRSVPSPLVGEGQGGGGNELRSSDQGTGPLRFPPTRSSTGRGKGASGRLQPRQLRL